MLEGILIFKFSRSLKYMPEIHTHIQTQTYTNSLPKYTHESLSLSLSIYIYIYIYISYCVFWQITKEISNIIGGYIFLIHFLSSSNSLFREDKFRISSKLVYSKAVLLLKVQTSMETVGCPCYAAFWWDNKKNSDVMTFVEARLGSDLDNLLVILSVRHFTFKLSTHRLK